MARRDRLFMMMVLFCCVVAACGKQEGTRVSAEPPPRPASAPTPAPAPAPAPNGAAAPATAAAAAPPGGEGRAAPKPMREKRREGGAAPASAPQGEAPQPAPQAAGPATGDPSFVIAQPTLGSSVIKVPSTMKEGRESIAQLIVSPTDLASLLKHSAVTGSGGDVKDAEQNVRLTPRMRASLSAPDFDFSPKDAQEQVVKAGEPTVWVWQLTPQNAGSSTLVFTLEGILTIDGHETAIRPPALTVPVQVEVNSLLFFEKYWQWLMTAIVIPVAGFFGKRMFDRRAEAGAKTSS